MRKLLLLISFITLSVSMNAQQGNGGSVISDNRNVLYQADATKLTKGKVTFTQGSSDKFTMPVYKRVATAPDVFGPNTSIGSFSVYFDTDNCQVVLQNNCSEPVMVRVSWSDGTTNSNTRISAGANQTGYYKAWDGFRGKNIKLGYVRMRKCAGIGHDK